MTNKVQEIFCGALFG